MNFEAACNALERHFKTLWAGATPIGYENDGQKIPETGNYVELRFEGSRKAKQASFGAATNRHRKLVYLWVTLYTPKGSGPHVLRGLMDTVINIFRGYKDTGITCEEPRPVGNQVEDEKWAKQLIMVPWLHDEIA